MATQARNSAFLTDTGGSNDLLAGITPIKPLPFSPSQFLNSPSLNLSFDVVLPASTPVRKHFQKVCERKCVVCVLFGLFVAGVPLLRMHVARECDLDMFAIYCFFFLRFIWVPTQICFYDCS